MQRAAGGWGCQGGVTVFNGIAYFMSDPDVLDNCHKDLGNVLASVRPSDTSKSNDFCPKLSLAVCAQGHVMGGHGSVRFQVGTRPDITGQGNAPKRVLKRVIRIDIAC